MVGPRPAWGHSYRTTLLAIMKRPDRTSGIRQTGGGIRRDAETGWRLTVSGCFSSFGAPARWNSLPPPMCVYQCERELAGLLAIVVWRIASLLSGMNLNSSLYSCLNGTTNVNERYLLVGCRPLEAHFDMQIPLRKDKMKISHRPRATFA